jgi:Transposase, Mutator family
LSDAALSIENCHKTSQDRSAGEVWAQKMAGLTCRRNLISESRLAGTDARSSSACIERYRRRESSVQEEQIEIYLAGISVRRVEDITEPLWGTRVSPSTVPNLSKKIYAKIEAWHSRRIEGEHPYLYFDGVVVKRGWAGEIRNLLTGAALRLERTKEP